MPFEGMPFGFRKPKVPKKPGGDPKFGKKPTTPPNYLRPGPTGKTYIAWETESGKKPDFGKGRAGPGLPYREVEKKRELGKTPDKPKFPRKPKTDAKADAIKRRLANG